MLRKTLSIATLSFIAIAFLAAVAFGSSSPMEKGNFFKKQANALKNVKRFAAGAEQATGYSTITTGGEQALGYDAIVSNSPGIQIGTSTYDLQSNTRMNRQVSWRGTKDIHMIWMRSTDSNAAAADLDRGTGYNAWDASEGEFYFAGGCDVHPRLGGGTNYSGYVSLDVDTEGKAVISNHHDEGAGYHSTVWYDFGVASCFFSPYKRPLPDSVMKYPIPPEHAEPDREMIWPQHEYQVYNGDTVTHMVSAHSPADGTAAQVIAYFRRVGSDTLGAWDYPPMLLDTIQTICQSVAASRATAKVAIAWGAPPGAFPGSNESLTRDDLDDGLGSSQRFNEIFVMYSDDMGSSWTPKENITDHDSTVGGWLNHGDISMLIDTDDNLHILMSMREILPTSASDEGGYGEYAHFWGSRLWHWDELNGVKRPVKDANWDLPDSGCTGGAWNEMSIVKPSLSECDGKFYAFFVQFNDIYNGIDNDCHDGNYTGAYTFNTANGEIWMSVSNDGGYSWDLARNLTNTYTSHCWQNESHAPLPVCESDHYVSSTRFGMDITGGNYPTENIVDPTGSYTGNYYIDVTYMNDKFPGSVMQD
ncbi:MAG: hypothetical protein ABIJ45_08950, partial [Candidatus Zixiibacteriota bacterium]